MDWRFDCNSIFNNRIMQPGSREWQYYMNDMLVMSEAIARQSREDIINNMKILVMEYEKLEICFEKYRQEIAMRKNKLKDELQYTRHFFDMCDSEDRDQDNIDDDRTKEETLKRKAELNSEFDKIMNPPIDEKHEVTCPMLSGAFVYDDDLYLSPGTASNWLRDYEHDIMVDGQFISFSDMSWQKMGYLLRSKSIDKYFTNNSGKVVKINGKVPTYKSLSSNKYYILFAALKLMAIEDVDYKGERREYFDED